MYELACVDEGHVLEDLGDGLVVKQIPVNDAEKVGEFSRFVFDIYREEFERRFEWRASEEHYHDMLAEEFAYCMHGAYFTIEHVESQQLMGTIRGIAWRPGTHFGFEEVTGISVPQLASDAGVLPEQIMHVSQVAVAETLLNALGYPKGRSRKLLETLFGHMFEVFLDNDIQMIVAETDPLVERRYSQLGARMTPRSPIFAEPPPFLVGARLSSAFISNIITSPRFPRVAARKAVAA